MCVKITKRQLEEQFSLNFCINTKVMYNFHSLLSYFLSLKLSSELGFVSYGCLF